MFSHVIVKRPAASMVNGISNANLGKPDYQKALRQHDAYIEALKSCDVEVMVLEADEAYPDSCFVEDPAIVTPKCAIITSPGAATRRGEEKAVEEALKWHYADQKIERISAPATIEGGDVMMVGDHFYIGLSARTNQAGADQLIAILERYGYSAEIVPLQEVLHLKTGLSYIENNNLLAAGEFVNKAVFEHFNIIEIAPEDAYSANCIWVNDRVLVPAGFAKTAEKISALGYHVIPLDMSEFEKLDGGLSCLSLRF